MGDEIRIMKEIKLTQGKVTLVDDEDYEWLNSFKWYAGKHRNTFYALRAIPSHHCRQKTQRMHMLIMGERKIGMIIDHKDGNGLNNQRSNTRFCTIAQNGRNSQPQLGCTSIYKGVCWHIRNNKFISHIIVDRKLKHLGYFNSEIEAAKAYDKAAKFHFKEFAYLNFPENMLYSMFCKTY